MSEQKIYEVKFTHVIERDVTAWVKASSEEEAIKKAEQCDWMDSNEEDAPEEGIETKDYRAEVADEDFQHLLDVEDAPSDQPSFLDEA